MLAALAVAAQYELRLLEAAALLTQA